jgi:hypothetical protein
MTNALPLYWRVVTTHGEGADIESAQNALQASLGRQP